MMPFSNSRITPETTSHNLMYILTNRLKPPVKYNGTPHNKFNSFQWLTRYAKNGLCGNEMRNN